VQTLITASFSANFHGCPLSQTLTMGPFRVPACNDPSAKSHTCPFSRTFNTAPLSLTRSIILCRASVCTLIFSGILSTAPFHKLAPLPPFNPQKLSTHAQTLISCPHSQTPTVCRSLLMLMTTVVASSPNRQNLVFQYVPILLQSLITFFFRERPFLSPSANSHQRPLSRPRVYLP